MDGEEIRDFADLLGRIALSRPGQVVSLTVWRDGELREVEAELDSRPEFQGQ
jgi:S1-C subfamily serine protease